ncbi:hypothetical protein GCM10023336_01720 [Streptomyces similanensis]|uniref:HAD family hydrolase n=1 Tax=Streptomyces similanensis TaxID=1274988 RepID=A0ABP9JSK3_9ACTN
MALLVGDDVDGTLFDHGLCHELLRPAARRPGPTGRMRFEALDIVGAPPGTHPDSRVRREEERARTAAYSYAGFPLVE